MVICFTSRVSQGCSFLDWSFNWLAGHKKYWFNEDNKWIDLPKNPLGINNAHLYKKNHPKSVSEWVLLTKKFINLSANSQPLTYYGWVEDGHVDNGYYNCVKTVLEMNIPVISLKNNYSPWFFLYENRTIDSRENLDESIISWATHWFPRQKDLKNKSIREIRNFFTFNLIKTLLPVIDDCSVRELTSFSNFLLLDSKTWIKNGEETIKEIFKFLKIEIVNERYDSWLAIYKEWQQILLPDVLFNEDLTKIVNCIKNGVPHSLKPYRLDVFKEAQIQHHLIKNYNDPLLVGNMSEFPDDALKLTSFLKSKKLS